MTPPIAAKHLRKRAQFLFVRQGKRAGRSNVVVEARRRAEDGPAGIGFTASRKVGPAVVRNRARRRLKEAVRQLIGAHGLAGVDYVFVARPTTSEAPWEALLDDVRNALIRLRAELESAQKGSSGGPRPKRP